MFSDAYFHPNQKSQPSSVTNAIETFQAPVHNISPTKRETSNISVSTAPPATKLSATGQIKFPKNPPRHKKGKPWLQSLNFDQAWQSHPTSGSYAQTADK